MPSVARRRPVQDDSSEEEAPRNTQRGRKQSPLSDDESEDDAEGGPGEDPMDVDVSFDSQDQAVKKMVRYALACEYQRKPIMRTGITEKVIGKQRGAFKRVFESAQDQLRKKFGMEMIELPVKEKITMRERRAAQKTKGNSKTTSTWILTTTLPSEYRIPAIMPVSTIGSENEEAAYIGMATMIVSIIALSPNDTLPDYKLAKYLERLDLGVNTPCGTTEALLKKLVEHKYIYKSIDKSADDETVDWRVGPRGKIEIGNKGIQGLVAEVYGDDAPEDLQKKLQRSLGVDIVKINRNRISGAGNGAEEEEEEEALEDGDPGPSRTGGRSRSGR